MRTLAALLTIIALFLTGCSGNVPLSGKVTFSDGEPVTIGNVFFVTPTTIAQAAIKKDGTYTVGSMAETDGMPKGEYQVFLAVEEVSSREVRGETMTTYTSLIDAKYTKAETSGLVYNADGKTKTFDITVERAPTRR